MQDPTTAITNQNKRVTFNGVPVGSRFVHNGNLYRKRSTRTATGIWPANVKHTSYIKQNEVCYYE